MRGFFRILFFLALVILVFVFDLTLQLLCLPLGLRRARKVIMAFGPCWARVFAFIMGIKFETKGRHHIQPRQNYCIIANHLSYLDILFVGALLPIRFVAKQDVLYWPLFGLVAWLRGSIFVDRRITGARQRPYLDKIILALRQGFNLIVFPEGTTSNGQQILPFKKTIFSGPIKAGVPILPVTIRYATINHEPFSSRNCDLVCWYGSMTFADHFWRVMNLKGFTVEITVHPPVRISPEDDWLEQNRRVASQIRDIIAADYPVPQATEPFAG